MSDEICDLPEEKFPIVFGIDTAAGKIIGLSISETFGAALTICSFMIIFVLFLICFPKIRKIDLMIQRWVVTSLNSCFTKCCGLIIGDITTPIFEFLISLRPPFITYLIFVGVIVGIFLRLSGLNETLSKELMQIDLDIFIVTYLSACSVKGTFMATRRKVYFPNFILSFFHHYALILLHALGSFFICFGLSFILYFLTFGKYSYLECLLLSSIVSILSAGAILGTLDELKVNLRLFEVLEGEDMLAIVICIMVYGTALPLVLGMEENGDVSAWEVIGLGLLRMVYMLTLGPIIGLTFGFIGCIFVKLTYPSNLRIFQPFLIYLFMFLSFFVAEVLKSHGMLGIIPCSIFMARYSYFCMTEKMRDRTEYLLELFAGVAGQLIYLYVGITFVEGLFEVDWDPLLIFLVAFFLFFLRVVYIITVDSCWNCVFRVLPSNTPKSVRIIPRREIFVLAFSGLKGALPFIFAFVLPRDFDKRQLFLTTTVMIIIPSLLIQAPLMISFLEILNLKKRRLSIRDKVLFCIKMIGRLEKCMLYIPHKDRCCTSSSRMKAIMASKVNKSWIKFRETTKTYYEAIKYEKERREKHFCWPKSKISVRIIYKGFEMLEKVYEWSNEVVDREFLIRIDSDYGVNDEDLNYVISLVDEMKIQSDRIQNRLSGLLKLKQYGESIIKIPDERYSLKMQQVGHIPIALSPDVMDRGKQKKEDEDEEKVENRSCKGCFQTMFSWIIKLWDKVDLFLQKIINIDGIGSKEYTFLSTTLLYRKYHWVSWNEEDDEDRLFLEDLEFQRDGKIDNDENLEKKPSEEQEDQEIDQEKRILDDSTPEIEIDSEIAEEIDENKE